MVVCVLKNPEKGAMAGTVIEVETLALEVVNQAVNLFSLVLDFKILEKTAQLEGCIVLFLETEGHLELEILFNGAF